MPQGTSISGRELLKPLSYRRLQRGLIFSKFARLKIHFTYVTSYLKTLTQGYNIWWLNPLDLYRKNLTINELSVLFLCVCVYFVLLLLLLLFFGMIFKI